MLLAPGEYGAQRPTIHRTDPTTNSLPNVIPKANKNWSNIRGSIKVYNSLQTLKLNQNRNRKTETEKGHHLTVL